MITSMMDLISSADGRLSGRLSQNEASRLAIAGGQTAGSLGNGDLQPWELCRHLEDHLRHRLR